MRGANPQRALELQVEREGGLRHGEHVLVACSGGPDSVALAAVLAAAAASLDLRLSVAHVNHGLRPSAWQDEAVVLRVAAALSLPVHMIALPALGRSEAVLRDARYEALGLLAAQAGASAVATGHTAQDQTETLLLALFRGTGPDGLAGMPVRRSLVPGVDLVRPLLRAGHDELAAYCSRSALPYALDPTNADPAYRRNAVRAALAALRPAFPGLDEAVARTAELIGSELAGADRSSLRRRVRAALRENDALADVDFEHVEAAVRALESNGSGRFYMNGNVELQIEKGAIVVRKHR